jgi:hypothetical protein
VLRLLKSGGTAATVFDELRPNGGWGEVESRDATALVLRSH